MTRRRIVPALVIGLLTLIVSTTATAAQQSTAAWHGPRAKPGAGRGTRVAGGGGGAGGPIGAPASTGQRADPSAVSAAPPADGPDPLPDSPDPADW